MLTRTNNNHHKTIQHGGIIERVFDDIFDSFWQPSNPSGPSHTFYDDGNQYRIVEEVPGWNKKDLKMHLKHNGQLELSGKINRKNEKAGTFRGQSIYKSYTLPNDADTNKIKAHVKDGILTISVDKQKIDNYSRSIPISGVGGKKAIAQSGEHRGWLNKIKNWFK